ncbi:balbiani ring protein 3-like isoform X4 [Bombus bifarius]|uniref:Balbiani ring protein 3-like isoform X4 n=1 Tax=Bombus bifarius TaxID=103933 RepID=A0A6P8MS48_9HYME|nr:balbiani ring protein 3-like isoform X4 [Bombus bifarius]
MDIPKSYIRTDVTTLIISNLGERELTLHTEVKNARIQNTKTIVMAETTNSQQQSNAEKTTDESSQNLVQNQSAPDMDTEISSQACNCETGCSTQHCSCVKAKIKCGQRCKCNKYGCKNQEETADSQKQSSEAQIVDESSKSDSENQSAAHLETEKYSQVCKCKEGCSTQHCRCAKAKIKCGQRCKCIKYACKNQVETTNSQQQSSAVKTTDESSQSLVQNQSVPDMDTEISSQACNCETGCSTQHCSCVKDKIKCGQRCKCKEYGCENQVETTNSQQRSSAVKTTDESSQSLVQNQSVPEMVTEISSQACNCETACSTQNCSCVKDRIKCGQRCKCKEYGCENQVETTNSQQQSSAVKTTDESSKSLVQNQSVPDMVTEISSQACNCETGCSTQNCSCVKDRIKCGQRCKCKEYGCENEVETTNSQQRSSAVKTTDESSQSLVQNQSVPEMVTEISSQACNCETACSTQNCSCVKDRIKCGQRCKCKEYGCENQVETTNSQQQSSAVKTTDESSQSLVQNQSVPDMVTEISSQACNCETGCSTQNCSCVKDRIKCGQRCKCKEYGCENERRTADAQKQSSVAQIVDESSESDSENQSAAHLEAEKSGHACKCKTGCSNKVCGCVKAKIKCGQRCTCIKYGCKNQRGTADSQKQSSVTQIVAESSESDSENQSAAHLEAEKSGIACKCKTGCSNKVCDCVKAKIKCGQRCKCIKYGCKNQRERADSQKQSSVAQIVDESSESDSENESTAHLEAEKSGIACKCKTGCSNKVCDCVKAKIKCGQRCKCIKYGCKNQRETAGSQKQSSVAQIVDVSSESDSEKQSTAHLEEEKSRHACKCKTGCSNKVCVCVKAKIKCGQRCKCIKYGCKNQRRTANSQKQSSVAQIVDESSESDSENESTAHLEAEKSGIACKCKTGCSNKVCDCVKAKIKCGQRCKCIKYGCKNQRETAGSQKQSSVAQIVDVSSESDSEKQSTAHLEEEKSRHACKCKTGCSNKRRTANSQKQSSVAQIVDESSESDSENESAAHLEAEKSGIACKCKTGCSNKVCDCVKAKIKCGQRCKCIKYGCKNQRERADSQKQSSVAQIVDESSESDSENQCAAHLEAEKSGIACKCKTGCSNKVCDCVKAKIKCGQRCKCIKYGCKNQRERADSQKQSNVAQIVDESSESDSENESAAHLEAEKSGIACKCKTGCSNKVCDCVKAKIKCGQRCKCIKYGCKNQRERADSQKQSNVAQIVDESSESDSENESAAHLEAEKSGIACKCKTGCSNKVCDCVKAKIKCGQRCKCIKYGCKNQRERADSQKQSSVAQIVDESSESDSENESTAHLEAEKSGIACKCKTGCSNKVCDCVKAKIKCGQRCKCIKYGCKNQRETAGSQKQSSVAQIVDVSSESDSEKQSTAHLEEEKSRHACKCKTGCSNKVCVCVKAKIKCGQRCKCIKYGCKNQRRTANSQKQSSVAQIVDESSESDSENESAAHLEAEKSGIACKCKTGCSNKVCDCVKAKIKCGQRCKCIKYGCKNQRETAGSQKQSSVAQIVDVSSESDSEKQSTAHLEEEKSRHACKCKTGCSNKVCVCVKAKIKCGQRCKCIKYGCKNQRRTANSQKQSSVAQIVDESSESDSENESAAHLEAEKSGIACKCKTGCSNKVCDCVKAKIKCGQRCKCIKYGCKNQRVRADSQKQSSVAQIVDESSESDSENQCAAHLEAEKSGIACKCKTGCSNKVCDCVKAKIKCGQRCKCIKYGCKNQRERADSQKQSSVAQIVDESSESDSENQCAAHLEAEKSGIACKCKTGCSNKVCDCVKAKIKCGQRCKCIKYGCKNQRERADSQKQSNVAQIVDESSESDSENESAAHLEAEKSGIACKCKTGCSNKVCDCVKAKIKCGQRCKCIKYGCKNQKKQQM